MEFMPVLAILVVAGAFAGVLAGLLGVGGGIVLVPAFYHVFSRLGYESHWLMQMCLATSLATIIVTSLRSLRGHHLRGAVDWDILRRWAPGIAIGAILGTELAKSLQSGALQVIFAGLALIIGLYMALGRKDWRLGNTMPGGLKRWLYAPGTGFLSVLLRIGGGSIGVPVMALHDVPMHRAVATAAGWGTAIAVPSVIGFLLADIPAGARPPGTFGAVNLPAFLVVISMTLLTTPIGVRLAHATDPVRLRRVFAIFLLLVAANMAREAIW
ncbi:MAG: sulfite exporter TauE/SafE family protein [Rhodobacteraceae bacterium]|nr:sulfite exporter TauE/SafE family protein [Paracoccaceae bacterium]